MQILNQDEMPLLYSLVFGEGVVNDATSVVLFNAIQKLDLSEINSRIALKFIGDFFFLFITSTLLGVLVSFHLVHSSWLHVWVIVLSNLASLFQVVYYIFSSSLGFK